MTDNISNMVKKIVQDTGARPTGRPAQSKRMAAHERRELILQAATAVFGERGYAGATTAQVAQAAGISQPYVVRMFGTKENLFLEALGRALAKLQERFRTVIAEANAGQAPDATTARASSVDTAEALEQLEQMLAQAYADLIKDSGILLLLMQSFVAGHEPVIGARAREGFLAIYTLLREEAGMAAAPARDFLAHGMLMNTLISLRLLDFYAQDTSVGELLECTMGGNLPVILAANKSPLTQALACTGRPS